MQVSEALKSARSEFKKAGIDTARLDAVVLLEYASKQGRSWLLAHPETDLSARSRNLFEKLVKQRAARIPSAYLTGVQEFYGLKFKVTPDVLIPRPETESLVEAALELNIEQAKVLDVGTGSGAIAIAIAKHRPKWSITATDFSADALKIARANARLNQVKIKFAATDLLANIRGRFDIIVANLPYLSSKNPVNPEAKFEPRQALFAGPDGLVYYRQFFAQVADRLKPGSRVIIEADPTQHPELIKLAASSAGLQTYSQKNFALAFSTKPKYSKTL